MKFTFMRLYVALSVSAVMLAACQSFMTYEELEEGAKTDPKIEKRLERFERDAERAGEFLETRYYCEATGDCYMFCTWHGMRGDAGRNEFKDLDDLVRWYRRVGVDCQFVKSE